MDNSGVQNNGDVWVYDLSRSVGMRLTSDPSDETDPVWSPDGTRLVFSSLKRGQADLHVMRSSGTAPEEDLEISEASNDPSDWSSDGRYLAYGQGEADNPQRSDLRVLDLESGEPRPFLATPFDERYAQFSPDGQTFLINEALGADTAEPMSLIINWNALAGPRP